MRGLWVCGWLGLVLVLRGLLACGDVETRTDQAGGTTTTSGSGGADADTSRAGRAGVGTAGAASGVAGHTSGGAASAPTLCGGAYTRECAADSLCVFDTTCGSVGSCVRKPSSCDNVGQPTCGCDGVTYGNPCEARSAGVAPQQDGACAAATQFSCGPYQCAEGNYCLDKGADGDVLWRYACVNLPAACAGTGSCACLGDVKACFGGHDCAPTGTSVTATCK
jgi:hypothetical protein